MTEQLTTPTLTEAMHEHRQFRTTFFETHKVALAPFFDAEMDFHLGGDREAFLNATKDARHRRPDLEAGITRYAAGSVAEPEPDFIEGGAG